MKKYLNSIYQPITVLWANLIVTRLAKRSSTKIIKIYDLAKICLGLRVLIFFSLSGVSKLLRKMAKWRYSIIFLESLSLPIHDGHCRKSAHLKKDSPYYKTINLRFYKALICIQDLGSAAHMKGKFDVYLLWPFREKLIFAIVARSTLRILVFLTW